MVQKIEPHNMKQTQKTVKTQLAWDILLLGGILSLMCAFFLMCYFFFVGNSLINSQNPLQRLLTVTAPTAAFSVVTWGMRRLQRTTNAKNRSIECTDVSPGADSNDEDSPAQSPANEQASEDDAIHHDQGLETTV